MTDDIYITPTAKLRHFTPALMGIMEAANPEYKITSVNNLLPFKHAVDRIGATAGRIYLREKN